MPRNRAGGLAINFLSVSHPGDSIAADPAIRVAGGQYARAGLVAG